MMSGSRSSADLDNLILLYKSRTNLLQMIDDLNLNVEIEDIGYEESVDIDFFRILVIFPTLKLFIYIQIKITLLKYILIKEKTCS